MPTDSKPVIALPFKRRLENRPFLASICYILYKSRLISTKSNCMVGLDVGASVPFDSTGDKVGDGFGIKVPFPDDVKLKSALKY